jgi:hypothetical protein
MAKYIIRYTLRTNCDDDIVSITWEDSTTNGRALLQNGNISCKRYPMTQRENLDFLDMVRMGETKNIEPGRILTIE